MAALPQYLIIKDAGLANVEQVLVDHKLKSTKSIQKTVICAQY
jgi:hypothetical protein